MSAFEGFDHVDCRVRSLALVEAFYDELMPALGLPRKRTAYVDDAGEWDSTRTPYNTVEYYEAPQEGRAARFIGFIERADHVPTLTRLAFRIAPARLAEFETLLARIGAVHAERSADMDAYPAIFFEDPAGTMLELTARA